MIRIITIIFFIFLLGHIHAQKSDFALFNKYDELEKSLNFHPDTTYIINFWATWCLPCVKELPYFEAFHKKFQKAPFKVILLSLDFSKQIHTHLLPFLEKNDITSKVWALTDTKYNDWMHKINDEWSGSIPATWIIYGKNHHFIEKDFKSKEDLESYILNTIK